MPYRHKADARAFLARLDEQLKADNVILDASEETIVEHVATSMDRRADIQLLYRKSDDIGLKLKLACEIRLIESAIARSLSQLHLDPPEAETATTRKARRAARARWDRERGTGNGP